MVSLRGPSRAGASAAGCSGPAAGRVGRGRVWVARGPGKAERLSGAGASAGPAAREAAARRGRTRGRCGATWARVREAPGGTGRPGSGVLPPRPANPDRRWRGELAAPREPARGGGLARAHLGTLVAHRSILDAGARLACKEPKSASARGRGPVGRQGRGPVGPRAGAAGTGSALGEAGSWRVVAAVVAARVGVLGTAAVVGDCWVSPGVSGGRGAPGNRSFLEGRVRGMGPPRGGRLACWGPGAPL